MKRPVGNKRYVPNLKKLQTICGRNYGLLLRMLPMEYSEGSQWQISLNHHLSYTLVVESVAPYTETMRLKQNQLGMPQFLATEIEFRVYHDAQMLEVLSFQQQNRLRQKYDYPNPKLHQKDEKLQVNSLLKDWFNLVINRQNEMTGSERLVQLS
ncbi:MAG: DUF1249 domain-containing protein [Gammaproteobacteria bacterium]|nr:DUF1249 domain-containing protein [Gammaproteobacteria bacterium]